MLAYRPDIDGLRALAVLLAVFYLGLGLGFRGGYCGVDVFFVISGYLITRLLLKEFAGGRFQFSRFWERRARRLGPALLVNAGAIAALAYFFLPPAELYVDSAGHSGRLDQCLVPADADGRLFRRLSGIPPHSPEINFPGWRAMLPCLGATPLWA